MITLLMAVYADERPEFLKTALLSLEEQSELPNEILLIKDGPLGANLEQVIADFTLKIGIRSVQLPHNVGLANALNVGLSEALHPWIMRFDSDDYCCSERVRHQKSIIATGNYDIFGSQIEEFDVMPNLAKRARSVPIRQQEILRFGKKRNPFNHMTVCFRKEVAQQCGGYPEIPFMEDYALWIKMLSTGARAMNDPQVLVKARIGNGMVQRRGGQKYLISEARLQSLMVRSGFKSLPAAVRDGVIRALIFILPASLRSRIYQKFLRQDI